MFDLDGAIENFKKTLQLDPEHADALNNLGLMYLLSGNCKEAVKHFLRSGGISMRLLTGINLGDAFRCQGDHESATKVHQLVLQDVKRLGSDYERYAAGEWLYNFMPLQAGDTQTIKRYVMVYTQEQKLAIAHFALALDYALGGRLADADGELAEAERLESGNEYKAFYVNKIAFLLTIYPNLDGTTKLWFVKNGMKLSTHNP
jgi:tetratricopeptide (TPR) repeat protein